MRGGRAIVFAWAVASAACRAAAPGTEAVATVNGEAITKAAFEELVARNMRRYTSQSEGLSKSVRARIEEGVLRRMIDDAMIEQRARHEGVQVTEAELTQHFAEHKGRFRNPQAFADYLARSDTSEAALREDLRKSLLRDRLIEKLTGPVVVTDDEVAKYYADNQAHFTQPLRMHVRRLLLRVAPDASESKVRTLAHRAQKLRDTAKHHPDEFALLCERQSDGPEAAQGGSMGQVTRGRMPELDRLVEQGLPEGAVSPVARTALGFELYQVSDVHPEHVRPLAEEGKAIRDALVMRHRNDRRQDVLRGLKEGARVQVLQPRPEAPAPAAAESAPPKALPEATRAPAPHAP